MLNKAIVRKEIKKIRSLLTKNEISQKSNLITQKVINNFFPKIKDLKNSKIAIYFSSNNEVDTAQIAEYLLNKIKNNYLCLPKIDYSQKSLEFKQYKFTLPLEVNKEYPSILEPESKSLTIEPQIIFLPLVACSKSGQRIGMGGGFYDRAIAKIKNSNQSIILIGLAYKFQVIEAFISDEYDQALDFIAHEEGLLECKNK